MKNSEVRIGEIETSARCAMSRCVVGVRMRRGCARIALLKREWR